VRKENTFSLLRRYLDLRRGEALEDCERDVLIVFSFHRLLLRDEVKGDEIAMFLIYRL
jgi:hypothetical protein